MLQKDYTMVKKQSTIILLLFLALTIIPLFNSFVILTREGGMHSSFYFVGYSTGFGARKFLGTIFSVLLPDYTTHRHLVPYIFGALLTLFLLFGIYFSRTFNNVPLNKSSNALPFFLLTVLYLASSYSILFFNTLIWLADIWLYLLTIFFVILFARFRSKGVWPIVYGILILTACLTHIIFCCLFLPLFVALFIYETFDGNKMSLRRALIYGTSVLSVAILFVCLWCFSSMNVTPEELSVMLGERANNVSDNGPWMLNILYGPSASNFHTMWEVGQFPLRYYQFPFLILLMSPLLTLFVTPWILCIRHSHHRVEKLKYLLMLCAGIILFLPIFAVATDYGRWMMAWLFCQTLLLLTMYRLHDTKVIASMQIMFSRMRRHLVLTVFLVAYILLLRVSPTDNAGVNALSFAHELYRNLLGL